VNKEHEWISMLTEKQEHNLQSPLCLENDDLNVSEYFVMTNSKGRRIGNSRECWLMHLSFAGNPIYT